MGRLAWGAATTTVAGFLLRVATATPSANATSDPFLDNVPSLALSTAGASPVLWVLLAVACSGLIAVGYFAFKLARSRL